ncbi:hypothetical protein VUR80DRAFT_3261 [Thermomyces stellatus]
MTTTMTQSSPPNNTGANADPANTLRPHCRRRESVTSTISIERQPAAQDRAIAHVEHYAHMTDFAALWGVLHFATSSRAARTVPRFNGRLFVRPSNRGGHQFCQHYLDGMFPLETDPETGRFVGVAENNEFMESVVRIGEDGDASKLARRAFDVSWCGRRGFGSGEVGWHVDVHDDGPASRPPAGAVVRVKELSRLWRYRNGRIPRDPSPLLTSGL